MKVINLFGGPCTGKSTLASGIFYQMKIRHLNVENTIEYAKTMSWEARENVLSDQLYILAKQNRNLVRLKDKVDWAIMDSPVILGWFYTPNDYYTHFKSLLKDVFDSYENINFYLDRNLSHPFSQIGRNQNLEESIEIDKIIRNFLDVEFIPYTVVPDDSNRVDFILENLGIK